MDFFSGISVVIHSNKINRSPPNRFVKPPQAQLKNEKEMHRPGLWQPW